MTGLQRSARRSLLRRFRCLFFEEFGFRAAEHGWAPLHFLSGFNLPGFLGFHLGWRVSNRNHVSTLYLECVRARA